MKNETIKRLISFMLCVITLSLVVVPVTSVYAIDKPQLKATMLNDDQMHEIAEQSTSKLPDELLQKLSLNDSDIPESMRNTDVKDTNAVVRLKAQEDDMTSVLYANSDGTYSEFFFSENVKYKKNGEVFDKSNALTSSLKLGGYTNEQNDINVKLPFMITKNSGVELSYEDYKIEFIPKNTGKLLTTASQTKDDTVVYKNAFGKGTAIEYTAKLSGIKENIIIDSDMGIYDFTFTVKTHGLLLKILDDHAVMCDGEDNIIAEIGGIIIFDDDGKTGDGSFAIEEKIAGEEYVYNISVSEDFIKSENTIFPVTIDPTITYNSGSYIYDSKIRYIVGSGYSMTTNDSPITIGYTGLNTFNRELINLKSVVNKVKSFNSNSVLKNAYLCLTNNPTVTETINLKCYRMSASWSYTGTTGSSTIWNGYVQSTEKSGAFAMMIYSTSFNITDYFQYWYNNTNNGLMIKLENESKQCSIVSKESTNTSQKPYVKIVFYDLPTSQLSEIKDKHLYRIEISDSPYLGETNLICNKTSNSSYSLTVSTMPSASSTQNASPYFAFRYISNGYYTISPTNANFHGSKDLYGTSTEYFLYRSGTNVILSTINGTDNNAYWYPMKVGSYYYLINKGNVNFCLCLNSDYNGVTYSNGDYCWKIISIGLDVPLIMQEDNNWCGPASILQCLTYLNLQNSIYGNTTYAKQSTIANYPVLDNNNDGVPRLMVNYLNDIIGSSIYERKNDVANANALQSIVYNSLLANYPVIAQLKPKELAESFYDNYPYNSGHFMVIVGYDALTNNYIVRDCNNTDYDGNGVCEYFGEFVIGISSLYNASYGTGRLVIAN